MKTKILSAFLLLAGTGLQAQVASPGGVSSPEIWFKTVPQTSDLQGNYLWRDFGGDSVKLRLYDSRGPLYGSEYATDRALARTYNFHPALDLSETGAGKQFLINKTNLSQATVIAVWGPDYGDFNQDMFLYALNGRPGNGYIFTKDKVIHSNESGKGIFDYGKDEGKDLLYQPTDEEPNVNKFREKALKIAAYFRTLQPNTSVWGEKDKAIITIGEIFHPSYPVNTSTFNTPALNNRAFYGYTPEFIIYNRILTPLERRKAETYLAVKYGLTLDMSYISSKDALIWDIDGNSGFNNRVTGYGRDQASGLYQKISTTSYEEAPYYSDDYNDLYDSYDLNNSYNLPSRYRLLVMGRQPASPVTDGQYVLFGDNNGSLTAAATAGINGIKLMPRRWLLNTNIAPASQQEKHFAWDVQNLDIYTEGFKTKATKAGSSAAASGSLVTSMPLLEKDGYFSWTITSTQRGPLTIKFGTNNPQITNGAHDYGYYISEAGLVYKIVKGVRQTAIVEIVYANQKIEIGKEGSTVYLRSNGLREHADEITIDATDENKTFYGSILINKYYSQDIVLSCIRQGGFSDTGNQLELSCIADRAYEFRNYRTDGKTFLIIDRTGTGDFSSENVEYIPADETDETRYKIIFNNVFWDTDGNGRDMFTFGYRQSNLVAVATQNNPSCLDDAPQADGEINVKIKQGYKAFNYSLINKDTKEERKGAFFTDSLSIKKLPAGIYDLSISESGGFNLYPKQSGNHANKAIASTYFNSTSNAYIEWTVSANTQAKAGMKTSSSLQSNPNTATVGYGLSCDNGQLYRIDKGAVSAVSLASVVPGDRIRVERVANKIYYKLNGAEIYSLDIPSEDRLLYNYAVAEVASGGIYNLAWNRMSSAASWTTTDNLAMESSSGDSFLQTVTLFPECSAPPVAPQPADGEADGRLKVYCKNPEYRQEVTVRIEMEEASAVTLLVFDLGGNPVSTVNLPAGSKRPEADVRLPAQGVYIIKAITGTGEYSRKVLSY